MLWLVTCPSRPLRVWGLICEGPGCTWVMGLCDENARKAPGAEAGAPQVLNSCRLPRLFSSRFWILPAQDTVFARFILSFFSQEAFLEAKKGSPSTVKSWTRPLSMSVILGGTFESWNDVSVFLSARLTEFCGDSVVSCLQPGAPGFTCTSLLLFLRVQGPCGQLRRLLASLVCVVSCLDPSPRPGASRPSLPRACTCPLGQEPVWGVPGGQCLAGPWG